MYKGLFIADSDENYKELIKIQENPFEYSDSINEYVEGNYSVAIIDKSEAWLSENITKLSSIPIIVIFDKDEDGGYGYSKEFRRIGKEHFINVVDYQFRPYKPIMLVPKIMRHRLSRQNKCKIVDIPELQEIRKQFAEYKRIKNVTLTIALITPVHANNLETESILNTLNSAKDNCLRSTDRFCRYGEYVVASLLECNEEGFELVQEKIQKLFHLPLTFTTKTLDFRNQIEPMEEIVSELKEKHQRHGKIYKLGLKIVNS